MRILLMLFPLWWGASSLFSQWWSNFQAKRTSKSCGSEHETYHYDAPLCPVAPLPENLRLLKNVFLNYSNVRVRHRTAQYVVCWALTKETKLQLQVGEQGWGKVKADSAGNQQFWNFEIRIKRKMLKWFQYKSPLPLHFALALHTIYVPCFWLQC